MEVVDKAKTIRLRSRINGRYLIACRDEKSVRQDRDGLSDNAQWTVELVENHHSMRLKSCYGKYLTASNLPMFYLGWTGRQILQTAPDKANSATEWEIESSGVSVLLKTRYGHFLRPYGTLPILRNTVSHDIPFRTRTLQKIQWEIEVLDYHVGGSHRRTHSDSLFSDETPFVSVVGSNY